MLDTNVLIAVMNRRPVVTEKVFGHPRRAYGLSVIVAHELLFGAFRALRVDVALEAFEGLRMSIVDFALDDDRKAGEIRAAFAEAGTPIGPYDALIAGQALARNLILVTRDVREFARVPGLRVEDWEGGGA
ncbi:MULTISPECIES: type II toxin-antitoxin system VapC family toxin [unclassified Methylobacterium]|uniref:type II toxin-antitoxin system VapC family toxin n=1 Tax=unclassified Methylobacterium TaxID=2615210 RepID=UPI002484D6BC|nr:MULTISPECIES: type II toxin-antitoxin system VapC family toxin [unclassified Methylobacterium]